MKPEAGDALLNGAMTLMGDIAPLLEGGYGGGTTNTLGAMMMMAAQEFERGAHSRVEAIRDLKDLFARAASVVDNKALAGKLTDASKDEDSDLLITSLNQSLATLRSLLIELHIHIEGSTRVDAKEIEDRIWQHLALDAERFGFVLEQKEERELRDEGV